MKVLKTAAIVIGAVALVATGVGLALGGAAATAAAGGSTFLGMTGATWMTVGAIASVTSGVLSLGMSLMASNVGFSSEGSPLDFQTNPQSGLPFAFGRTRMSGLKIRGATAASSGSTTHNLLFFAAMLSCTPAEAIEAFKADNVTVAFNGTTGNATTLGYTDWMAQKVYLGANPQSTALSLSLKGTAFPGWTSAHKLSGRVHALWALTYDPDGNLYSGGVPEPQWIGKWAKCYDPRKDSTYPGGSGSHRIDDYSTHEWTRNGALIALKWARGHWESGKLVCGIGAPAANIRIADFVEAANVADANGWGCGGVEWTTDSKWDVFKRILQTCGAMPSRAGAMIGCRVQSPKTSIGTIAQDDFLDEIVWPAMKPRRDRFNTVLPRYRSEAHDWAVITGSAVASSTYVTEDGGTRTKGIDFPLVQSEVGQAGFDGEEQVGQLSAYAIADSREAGPIEWTTGPKWAGLQQGDCVILDKPDDDIVSQKVVILAPPQIDPASGRVKFVCQTETDAKHSFALGKTTVAPPTPTLSVPAGRPVVPSGSNWTVTASALADGQPALRLAGSIADPIADRLLVNYRLHGTGTWLTAPDIVGTGARSLDIGPLDAATDYDVRIAHKAGDQTGDWLEISSIATGVNGLVGDIPLGQNAVINSEFTAGLLGWSGGWDGNTGLPVARGLNLAGWSGQANVAYAVVTGTPAAGTVFDGYHSVGWEGDWLVTLKRWALPLMPGERIYFGGLVAAHRCTATVLCLYYDGDGNYITEDETAQSPANTPDFANGNPANATRLGEFATAPTNVRYAILEVRAHCLGGQVNPYIFYSQMFLAKVPANQTAIPPYTPGPSDRAADRTGSNTALDTANVGGVPTATLLATINAIGSDAMLSRGEKPNLVREWTALSANYTELNAKAGALGVAGAQAAAAAAKMSALQSYLTGLSPSWADYATDTPIVAATFFTRWSEAYATVAALQAAIQGLPGANGTDGVDGIDGTDGKLIEFVWKRAATLPATPTGNGIPSGWSDDPPAGSDPLWMSKAKQELDGTLVAGESWSTPIRHDGPPGANGTNGTNGTNGADGDDGTDALTISARPANHVVPCYANGTPKGSLPVFEIKVYQGATDVTSSASYGAATVVDLTGYGTLGGGVYWASGFTSAAKDATGYIEVPISYNGASGVARLVYSKACDGNSAVSFDQPVFSLATNGTYVTSANINVTLANGQTLLIASSGSYFATGGTYEPQVKLAYQNVTDGGAETDISGSEVLGGSATAIDPESWFTTGSLTNSTGASKVFNIRFKSRQNSGAGDATSVSGTLGGSAS